LKNSKNILYCYPQPSTFILKDIELLRTEYEVTPFLFSVKNKFKVPFQFIRQFFFLLTHLRKSQIIICHFAGYASFLPAIFGKLFNKPCFIIVAGNDAACFPDFNYGNYTKNLLGKFTGWSLQLAKCILPVHESLVFQEYDYYSGGQPAQGYTYFSPKTKKNPFFPLYYGYDPDYFHLIELSIRQPNSFVTIGNLSDTYAFKRKGFDLIIELAKKFPQYTFTFIGWDGITQYNLPKNIELLKFMPQQEIVKILNTRTYYFQLSIMEGFPNALAEAMLCGCIPIGSNVSGIPFIIGETGYLLKKHELHDLVKLIEQVTITKDSTKSPLKSRNRIVQNFTLNHRMEGFKKVIATFGN
jgi:glycosyltransferase involved in cell wall biosynthesis